MVAGIVAGDPTALAAAYDHYAPALYVYSRSLLSEPADAAEAVLDTFVVAALRLPGLRDPGRLRPWLYAVARNECHRRLHVGAAPPSTDEVPEPDPELDTGESTADLSAALEQAELRELAWSALSGLEPGDREIVELSMRHEFYGADLADALGVPRNQAHALGSRARQRFETAVSTLVAAMTGYGSCPALAEILGSWEGELTPSMRREVRQHIAECGACGAERRAVSASAMLALLPVPALPEDLRYQVLGVITDGSADAVRCCGAVAERAEPFLRSGFPVPLDPLAAVRGPTSFIPAAGVLLAVFAVFGGGAMLAANSLHHSSPASGSVLTPPSVPSASAQPAPAANGPAGAPGQSGSQNAPQVTPVGVLNPSGSLPTLPSSTTSKSSESGTSSSPGPTSKTSPSPGRDPSPQPTQSSSTPKPTKSSTPPTTTPPTTTPPTTTPPTTTPPTTTPPTTTPPTTTPPTTTAPVTPAPATSGAGSSVSGSGGSPTGTSSG